VVVFHAALQACQATVAKVHQFEMRLTHSCGAATPQLPRRDPEDPRARPWADIRGLTLQPGSVCARRFLAEHPMVLQVGRTMFVHGGLHPSHVDAGIDTINASTQVRCQLLCTQTSFWYGALNIT
jgi:hypothetical protein